MLEDPLVVAAPVGGADAVGPGIGDFLGALSGGEQLTLRTTSDGDGSSSRKGTMADGTKVVLKVSHSTSNENKPLLTDRSVIRFDLTRFDVNGRPVVASAYAVFAFPQGSTFVSADVKTMGTMLASFLLQGGKSGNAAPRVYDPAVHDTLIRLTDGEA